MKSNQLELIGHDEKSWLDNKREYHTSNIKLLHDIQCLANTRHDGDRYLVFGINDDNRTVVGVEKDSKRKQNADIQDLLRQSNFNRIPTVEINTLSVGEHEIDILTVFDRPDKPFFLLKDKSYKGDTIRAGVIYTRLGDTNTPLGECATEADTELMWRERFGIGLQPLQRFDRLLDDLDGWEPFDELCYYNRVFPEFTIVKGEDICDPFEEDWAKKFPDPHACSFWVQFRYHATVLRESAFIRCDGARYYFPLPRLNADRRPYVKTNTMEWKVTGLYRQYDYLQIAFRQAGIMWIENEGETS